MLHSPALRASTGAPRLNSSEVVVPPTSTRLPAERLRQLEARSKENFPPAQVESEAEVDVRDQPATCAAWCSRVCLNCSRYAKMEHAAVDRM